MIFLLTIIFMPDFMVGLFIIIFLCTLLLSRFDNKINKKKQYERD